MVVDPKDAKRKEDEFFKRKDSQLLSDMQKQHDAAAEKERLQKLKDLHFMHCPKCGQNLEERSLDEVKIDVCGTCGGIWLDKGELELLRKKEGFLIQHLFKIFS